MGTTTKSASPNSTGSPYIWQFSSVDVRVSKVTITATTSQNGSVEVLYGDIGVGKFVGAMDTTAGVPMTKQLVNYGTSVGRYMGVGARTYASNVLKSFTVTVEYEEPAPASATINIKVADSVTMQPIAGASVSCSPVITGESSPKTTDGTGMATFRAMAGIGVNYSATKDGYNPSAQLYKEAMQEGGVYAKQINLVKYVTPPPVTPPVTPTATTGNIEVYAKDVSGNLIASARVELNGYVALTPSMLPARFDNLTAKSYSYTVSKSGYNTKTGTTTVTAGTTASLTVTLEQSVTPVSYYNLTVLVQDSLGSPVSGAEVRLNGQTRTTDEVGKGYFNNTAGGSYTIYVTKSNIETATKSIVLSTSYTETVTVSLSSVISQDLIDLCTENGIPTSDIPTYPIICDNAIIITFETEPRLDVQNVYSQLVETITAKYPDVHILGIKQYGKKVVIFTHDFPVAILIIGIVAMFITFFGIALPAIVSWASLAEKREMLAGANEEITKILNDNTLTGAQKQDLINKLLATTTTAVTTPETLIGQIATLAIIIGAVVVAWKVLPSLMGKKGGK